MTPAAGTIITGATVVKLVLGALFAGVGVTSAFSLLIYCAERAIAMRREDRGPVAMLYQAASLIALLVVVGIVVGGFILMANKPK
jgi:nitric oxide reductase large subunit